MGAGTSVANSYARSLAAARRGDDAHKKGAMYVSIRLFGQRRAVEERGQSVALFFRKL